MYEMSTSLYFEKENETIFLLGGYCFIGTSNCLII
jgi:hypothetical protein